MRNIKEQIIVSLQLYSQAPSGQRIATFVLRIPKFVYGHILSHRIFSRNSASSRAMPGKVVRAHVVKNPYVPIYFGQNKKGMVSGDRFVGWRSFCARGVWLAARYGPVIMHWMGERLGIHKEVLNRMLEPWLSVDCIITATDWDNFIKLRTAYDAQPEMQHIANRIKDLLATKQPHILDIGQWHIPFLDESDASLPIDVQKCISAARCARISYTPFDSSVRAVDKDQILAQTLITHGHWSPFEHQAQVMGDNNWYGNFRGWKQYRKELK